MGRHRKNWNGEEDGKDGSAVYSAIKSLNKKVKWRETEGDILC